MSRKSLLELGIGYSGATSMARTGAYEKHEPMYMYHVSANRLHEDDDEPFVMHPKTIMSGEDELFDIGRICVAPTIEQCLVAIINTTSEHYYVYRTLHKAPSSIPAYGVTDAPLTQERWFCRSRKFVLCAKIPTSCGIIYKNTTNHELNIGGLKLYMDYRGSEDTFDVQQQELYRLRSYFRKYSHNYFKNSHEHTKHTNQNQKFTKLNRTVLNKRYKHAS